MTPMKSNWQFVATWGKQMPHINFVTAARNVLLAAVVGAVVLPVAAAAPAQAAERVECTRFDYKCDKTGYGSVANKSFWTMTPGHNCTNYVAYRLIRDGAPRNLANMYNATDWARDARKHGYPVDGIPAVGSVAQWMRGSPNISYAGHVAYVEAVGPNSITVTEDNYPSGPLQVRVITRNDPAWPSNFINFRTPVSTVAPASAVAAVAPVAPTSAPIPGFPAFDWMNAWFPQFAKSQSDAQSSIRLAVF